MWDLIISDHCLSFYLENILGGDFSDQLKKYHSL